MNHFDKDARYTYKGLRVSDSTVEAEFEVVFVGVKNFFRGKATHFEGEQSCLNLAQQFQITNPNHSAHSGQTIALEIARRNIQHKKRELGFPLQTPAS